ncbi:MAG: SNF2-related protein, partial [Verrucomicrobiae bacterium]|nr:SNF2-related protein [Verrucomicrobiae bacterium]
MRLHDYQRRAADFLVDHPFAFLMLEVGLGKTAATLTALRRLVAYGEVRRVLVVAPKRVAEHVWPAERERWAPDLDMALAVGTPAERMAAITAEKTITVIGRDNVPWLVDQFGRAWPFDTLVLDESQSFKDHGSQRFKALRKVGQHKRTILLSATPASESLLGLWAQVFLGDRGQRLGKAFTAVSYTHL